MTDEPYTPSTGTIRDAFSAHAFSAEDEDAREAEFDRWLAAHDAVVRLSVNVEPRVDLFEKITKAREERDTAREREAGHYMNALLLGAVIEKVRDAADATYRSSRGQDRVLATIVLTTLRTAPADVLAERDAQKWDEGMEAMADAFENDGVAVNPYRTQEDTNGK